MAKQKNKYGRWIRIAIRTAVVTPLVVGALASLPSGASAATLGSERSSSVSPIATVLAPEKGTSPEQKISTASAPRGELMPNWFPVH
jgi:hypothetical protein